MHKCIAICIAALLPLAAAASTLHTDCLVTKVSDGDSMTVQCHDREKPTTIRLVETDAPELAHSGFVKIQYQPWGIESRQALLKLCLGKHAIARFTSIDRYGRQLAYVTCDGINANYEQIKQGNAWAFMPAKDSPALALQAAAQLNALGLWSQPGPVRPSEWRKKAPPTSPDTPASAPGCQCPPR